MPSQPIVPPADVLHAFGVGDASIDRLQGGDETSLLVDGVVFKHVMDPALAAWTQQLIADSRFEHCRAARPVATGDGNWVIGGWTATRYVPHLRPLADTPDRVVAVGRHFAAGLNHVEVDSDSPIAKRTDRWAIADRFAWNETEVELSAEASELAAALRRRITIDTSPLAMVHGDLTGNVFVDPDGLPVVLDVTLYQRPREYASAIVVADHLLWHGGGTELVDLIDGAESLLARALLFRMVAEQLAVRPRHGADLDFHRRAMHRLAWSSDV